MTLREHLEAILKLHREMTAMDSGRCACMNFMYDACPNREHAVAALAILDAAEQRFTPPSWQTYDAKQTRYRLVPDASPDPQDTNT